MPKDPGNGRPLDYPPSEKTRVKRLHERARYDRESAHAILDAGLLCHVGYVIDGQPYVTPTAYWREDDWVYWHGSSASKMLRKVKEGVSVCLTVAMLDGLVLARSGFHSSVNYRSLMAFGQAELVAEEAEKIRSLDIFIDRLTPGRAAEVRPPTSQEMKATTVLRMKLSEVAMKIRNGPPADDDEDYDLDVWAGVVPIRTVIETPQDDPRLKDGVAAPGYLDEIRINRLD